MKNAATVIVNETRPAVNAFTVIIGDTTKTETGTRKANKRQVSMYTLNNDKRISDFAAAYLMEESKRATFRALKTVYQKSADAVIYKLMRECAAALGESAVDFENWITDEHGAEMVTAKTHTKQRDNVTGKMLACRPYVTFEFTETGRMLDSEIELDNVLDIYDLIDTAYCAYLELVNAGAVIDYRDIKRNRGHVYKCIRKAIYENKKRMDENRLFSDYCIKTDESGKETIYTGKHIDRCVKVDTAAALAVVLECLESIAHKNANCRAAVEAFKLWALDGYTMQEIAGMYGVSKMQISKRISLVSRIADNAETREKLAELLNA